MQTSANNQIFKRKVPEFFTRNAKVPDFDLAPFDYDLPEWNLGTVYDVMKITPDEELAALYSRIKMTGGNNQFEFLFEYLMESRFQHLVKMINPGLNKSRGIPNLTFDHLPIYKKD